MANNFKCNNCGKSFFVSKYPLVFRNGELVLANPHQCYHCQSYDTERLPKPKRDWSVKEGEYLNFYGKFSSASDEKKKEILTQRANAHYNKKGKEQKREMFKNTMRKMS